MTLEGRRGPPHRRPHPEAMSPRSAAGHQVASAPPRVCGRGTATLAAMKKLLLLVVIAALATLATKKVRSA